MPASKPPSRSNTAKSRGPKSFKSDGTEKKRWSSSERKERGHDPRRRGGQPATTWGTSRPERREDVRPERRSDSVRSAGPARDDRRPSSARDDRPRWENRSDDRRPSTDRNDRRPAFNRDDRPAFNRDDRPAFNRDDRRPSNDRDERRPSFNRDDRPSYKRDDRPSYNRDDRPSYNRDDRRPSNDRDERRPSFNRDDRPSFSRDSRPRWENRTDDRRPARSDDRRPSFDRDDRRPSFDRDDRRPSFNRDDRPAVNRDDRRPTFNRDDRPRSENRSEHVRTSPRDDRRTDDQPEREVSAPTVAAPVAAPTSTSGDFAGLGLPPALVSALTAGGITSPFPIQTATIPDALKGRDVLGRGQTGSGKTLAFGLPMVTRLSGGTSTQPRGLVLVPTRELAMQVTDVLTPLARTAGLSTVLIAGGMSYTPQLRAFQRGVDIVVATPGRLIDLMDQNAVDLTRVEVVVLDEADHMADLGFMPAVTQILDTVPAGGQRMLFSATLDGAIDRLVRRYLSNPVTHEVDSSQASVTTMAHHLVYVAPHDKATLTAEIAGRGGRTVVFVRTQRGADRVAEQLRDAGVMAGALHGGLTQGARTRILSVFKEGDLPVLVATDVAARGIHVDEVGLVLQVDPPAGPKEYLHRAGRTARAGGTGVVVTLALPHQRREMTRLTSQAGVKPESLTGQPGDAAVATITGARQPSGVPVSSVDYERLIAPPRSNRKPFGGDRGSRGPRSRSGGYEGKRSGPRRSFDR
ncbi:DEAD/DEAH box helicase [uncultured Friedmanniella sp.]|uniref:DEAD/DEAH box helicase n=1 Tax=uncultured Friedmanniella sp. TaxID=335381 RepID=UPI0035CAA471